MEAHFEETSYLFHDWNEEDEEYYEIESLSGIDFDEDNFEVVEIEEIDFEQYSGLMLEQSDTYTACYDIPELKDGKKLEVTMYKVLMPNKEILSIPCLTDDNAEFLSSCNIYGCSYYVYDQDGKREATDDEIDMLEP